MLSNSKLLHKHACSIFTMSEFSLVFCLLDIIIMLLMLFQQVCVDGTHPYTITRSMCLSNVCASADSTYDMCCVLALIRLMFSIRIEDAPQLCMHNIDMDVIVIDDCNCNWWLYYFVFHVVVLSVIIDTYNFNCFDCIMVIDDCLLMIL